MLAGLVPIASLIVSLLSIVAVIYLAAVKLARIELKVDTMWEFQLRRAFSEAVSAGIATSNSPLQFTQDALAKLAPIKEELHDFWRSHKRMNDADVTLAIERHFGDLLLTQICVPCRLSHAACLLVALAVARGTDTVDLTL